MPVGTYIACSEALEPALAASLVPSGSAVCNFSVAVSGYDFKAKGKITTWVRVAIWGKRGQTLVKFLTKGSKVALTGEMVLRDYNGKTSVEVKAQDVTLLGGKTREEKPLDDDSAAEPFEEGGDNLPF